MADPLARLAGAVLLATIVLGSPAKAEDTSRDRADFEAAAGRALLFEATSIVDNDPLRPPPPARREASAREASAREIRPERRAVRVVLPSPYGR